MREDIKQATARMNRRFNSWTATSGAGAEIKKLERHLFEGEQVIALVSGMYARINGLVTLTDRRLLFTAEGLVNKKSEDFLFSRISSIEWKKGIIHGEIRIRATGAEGVITQVEPKGGEAMVREARARLTAPAPGTAAVPPTPDLADQLQKLSGLRDQGILTPAESEAKKAEILARM